MDFAERVGLPQAAAERALGLTIDVAGGMVDAVQARESPWRGKARDDLVRALQFRLTQRA